MKNPASSTTFSVLFFLLLLSISLTGVQSQTCRPTGKLRGKKPPPGQCNTQDDADCCEEGKVYFTYMCSPAVTRRTKATLKIKSFEKGGGGPSECDNKFHSDNKPYVALSTGWFNDRKRCLKYINIFGNGRRAKAMVVDKCDSTDGCDEDHDYQPPCPNNVVVASKAVWKALGVPERDAGELDVFWSDH